MRRPILTLCICAAITLFAAATASAQSLSPRGYNFPATQVGARSAPTAFVLTAGALPLTSNVTVSAPTFPQTNNCPATLLPLTSCTINVVFAPTKPAPQQQRGTLTAGGIPASLAGTAIGDPFPVKKCKKRKGKKGAAAAKKKRKCRKKGKKK